MVVTWSALWGVIAAIAAIVVACFAIWWRIEGKIAASKQSAYLKCDAASAKADLTATQLAEYKTHVAETYVSKAGHRESTEQIMGAINSVKSAVEGTNQRIDRMFDDRAPNRRSS